MDTSGNTIEYPDFTLLDNAHPRTTAAAAATAAATAEMLTNENHYSFFIQRA